MASSLFGNSQQQNNPGNGVNQVMGNMLKLKSMLTGSGIAPQKIAENMFNNIPQFKQFMIENKGLSPEQVAQKYGVDMSLINKLIK